MLKCHGTGLHILHGRVNLMVLDLLNAILNHGPWFWSYGTSSLDIYDLSIGGNEHEQTWLQSTDFKVNWLIYLHFTVKCDQKLSGCFLFVAFQAFSVCWTCGFWLHSCHTFLWYKNGFALCTKSLSISYSITLVAYACCVSLELGKEPRTMFISLRCYSQYQTVDVSILTIFCVSGHEVCTWHTLC